MNNYIIQKRIYNENDYLENLWHDNKVYSLVFNDEKNKSRFKIEIDFILEWIYSDDQKSIKTWQIPAILIFNNVFDLKINLGWESYIECERNTIEKKRKEGTNLSDKEYSGFNINLGPRDNGQIILSNVTTFDMHLLGNPELCEGTYFDINKRNTIVKDNIDFILSI